jgi:hypothetical protein
MGSRAWRWAGLAAWVGLIYATVPLVRTLQRWIANTLGSATFGYLTLASILLAAVVVVVAVVRGRYRPRPGSVVWLLVIATVFVWWTFELWERPEEAVHLVEYAVLGVLAYRALRMHVRDATVFVSAAILVILVGTVDEIIQWITPERYWDWRDVGINAGTGALTQLALWKATAPSAQAIRAASWRLPARLMTAQLVVLALCLANTPARVQWYASRVPGLGFLADNQNTMTEYGHLHASEPIGRFRSRFTTDQLEQLDVASGAEVGALLDAFPDGRYGEFLRSHPPGRHPFAHEARVHLFSRDRNLSRAREHAEDRAAARMHLTRAVRENRILEHHFANTLAHSSSTWSARRRLELEAEQLPDLVFTSKVSAHLITVAAEWQLLLTILIAVLALTLVDRRAGKEPR